MILTYVNRFARVRGVLPDPDQFSSDWEMYLAFLLGGTKCRHRYSFQLESPAVIRGLIYIYIYRYVYIYIYIYINIHKFITVRITSLPQSLLRRACRVRGIDSQHSVVVMRNEFLDNMAEIRLEPLYSTHKP